MVLAFQHSHAQEGSPQRVIKEHGDPPGDWTRHLSHPRRQRALGRQLEWAGAAGAACWRRLPPAPYPPLRIAPSLSQ